MSGQKHSKSGISDKQIVIVSWGQLLIDNVAEGESFDSIFEVGNLLRLTGINTMLRVNARISCTSGDHAYVARYSLGWGWNSIHHAGRNTLWWVRLITQIIHLANMILTGFSVFMFGATLWVLFDDRRHRDVNWVMVVVACLLLIFSTIVSTPSCLQSSDLMRMICLAYDSGHRTDRKWASKIPEWAWWPTRILCQHCRAHLCY